MRKTQFALATLLCLAIAIPLVPAQAAVKAGAACSKAGAKSVASGKTFTCIKSGKKFVWDKGVAVKRPTVAITPTPTPVTTPTPTPTPTTAPAVDLRAECKLPVADGRGDVSIGGWPRIAERSKVLGDVTATVIMVDFPDAPATMTPAEALERISPAQDVFKEMSYGKLSYNLKPQMKWYRMSKNSSDYVVGGWTFQKHKDYIIEAARLADPEVDFSSTDNIIILANPDARGIGNSGPAFAAIRGNGITLDGKYISNGTTSAYDLNYWKSIWLNHEIAHTMGLADLYSYTKSDASNTFDAHRHVGEFSFMSWSSYISNAPSLFAFERWNLGWLDDSQIECMKGASLTKLITPVQSTGGTKAVIIPLSRTKAIVIESRRALGIDKAIAKPGALVYLVDSSVQSGRGPVQVYPSDVKNDPRYLQAPRALGESVIVEGFTIKVTQSDASGDTVEITK
jgi:M6 family metalloprotease-like protein